ncbi:protein LRATD2-like, partial [Phyllostomus hastatus]|uniref:protein LRATD2-like n=1 Tax=Phyllostomus hastatus TaxID=9423 RepID=UPI001E680BC4
FSEEPRPGDIIDIFHIGYKDWAIYVGDGNVIHLTPPNQYSRPHTSNNSEHEVKAVVKYELLKDVANNDSYKVNNYLDRRFRPRPVDDIVKLAMQKIGEIRSYNVFKSNCEHFVTELRNGHSHSEQDCEVFGESELCLCIWHCGETRGPQVSSEYNPGDLIEISRPIYQHWALYLGDGYVVHLAPPSEYAGAAFSTFVSVWSDTAEVKKERLTYVARRCNHRVNNELDKELDPLPVKEILSSVYSMIGKKVPYDITTNNCEHFVTELRYGEPRSLQVENAAMGAGLVSALGAAAIGAATLANSIVRNWSHPSDSLKKSQDPALEAAEQPTAPTSAASLTPAPGQPAVLSLALPLADQRKE